MFVCVAVYVFIYVFVCVYGGCRGDTFSVLWWLSQIWFHAFNLVSCFQSCDLQGSGGSTAWGKNISSFRPLIVLLTGLLVSSGFSFGGCSISPPFAPQIYMQYRYTVHRDWAFLQKCPTKIQHSAWIIICTSPSYTSVLPGFFWFSFFFFFLVLCLKMSWQSVLNSVA